MATAILFDTDVIIDYLSSQSDAVSFVEGVVDPILLSAVSVAEHYAGVREGTERTALESLISAFQIVPIDQSIATQGGLFRRDFGKSHSVGLPDALIAATATASGATLATLNRKHFPMLANVIEPYQKP